LEPIPTLRRGKRTDPALAGELDEVKVTDKRSAAFPPALLCRLRVVEASAEAQAAISPKGGLISGFQSALENFRGKRIISCLLRRDLSKHYCLIPTFGRESCNIQINNWFVISKKYVDLDKIIFPQFI
jgi:hypothetical protein